MDISAHPPKDLRPFLLAILATGVRKADVARNLGVSRACISDAAKPSDKPWMPSYAMGFALLAMHKDLATRSFPAPVGVAGVLEPSERGAQ